MITLDLAKKLKQNGLRWKPALHDFFAVPDRGMDQRIFVITDMLANLEKILGSQVVAFQGASEWALDYLVTSEAVWIPTESQLRQALIERIPKAEKTGLSLDCSHDACTCRLSFNAENLNFEDQSGAQAYGLALLHVLKNSPRNEEGEEAGGDIWEAGLRGSQEH
jgi:hypothetical protein